VLNKTLLGLSLVAAFSTASLVQADEYHVVVPAPGKAAPYASIKLELNPASLPVGFVGDAYAGFDFTTALRITGDSELDMSQVAWSRHSGELPDGLTLARDGILTGSPTEGGQSSFQALAKYKTKTAVRTYVVGVKAEKQLINQAGVRYWEDHTFARSCLEYLEPTGPYTYAGATGDGLYKIQPEGIAAFEVYCDMTTDGGGWTVVQRRVDGSVDFYRNWKSYQDGFGSLTGEHWLGLDRLHSLVASPKELRIDMRRYDSEEGYAKYSNFSIDGVELNYRINSATFEHGNVGDSLTPNHIGMEFTTFDADNDVANKSMGDGYPENCAVAYSGAWWYRACHDANLNGLWLNGPTDQYAKGIVWKSWTTHNESLSFTEMKVR